MKQRSAAYPYYSIKDSIDFSERIYKNYGNNYRATREEIAEALNYSPSSLTQKVSSATQYGLLDMKSKEGYQVTDLFVKYHRPISDEDKRDALIEAFKNPPLYSDLIATFENNILPPLKPLANILLQKHSISEKACDKAALVFEENAELIDLLSEDRVLSFGDSIESNKEEEEEVPDLSEQEEISNNNNHTKNNSVPPAVVDVDQQNNHEDSNNESGKYFERNPIPHNIPLKNKMPAQLLLPHDVTSSDFDFIISYIGLIRNQY